MVRWYDPRQLARTGVDGLISTIFGRHSDKRLVEALGCEARLTEYSYLESGTLWIDYVADLGDGWNPTYAIASAVGRPELRLEESGKRLCLPRARILILGGDEAYPAPSRENYRDRLIRPYEAAFPRSESPHPTVFAIPGNHDWYDSLVSFTRLFCTGDGGETRWIGGWQTRQSRSYFALRLPGRWWLLGTDVQLGADIDEPQVEFFRGIAKKMEEPDRVVLCNAVPEWIYREKYGEWHPDYDGSNLRFLEEKILRDRVALVIAGDSHYYRRHATDDGRRQRIVCGGGGAFAHPTHDLPDRDLPGGFRHRKSFPSVEDSKRYSWWNLAFPFINPWFGLLMAVLYLFTAWIMVPESVLRTGSPDISVQADLFYHLAGSPGRLLWALLLVGSFVLFTDTHSRWYRAIAGPLHGLAHLLVACALGWTLAHRLGIEAGGSLGFDVLRASAWLLGMLIGGWLLGGLGMGTYLLVSLNAFGRHGNEAFSSLRCQDWKSFLRMKVDANGTLTIYPIGLRRVPRRWKEVSGPPRLVADDPKATSPSLIDEPIVLHGIVEEKQLS